YLLCSKHEPACRKPRGIHETNKIKKALCIQLERQAVSLIEAAGSEWAVRTMSLQGIRAISAARYNITQKNWRFECHCWRTNLAFDPPMRRQHLAPVGRIVCAYFYFAGLPGIMRRINSFYASCARTSVSS